MTIRKEFQLSTRKEAHDRHPRPPLLEGLSAPPEPEASKRHTISVLVENKFGAFNRIAGLFAAKGYNIDSLSVGPTEDETVSRMTIVTRGRRSDHRADHQAAEQAHRHDQGGRPDVRELRRTGAGARQGADRRRRRRSEIMQIAEIFRAKVVDISPRTLTLEATGSQQKVDAIIKMLKPFVDQGDRPHRAGGAEAGIPRRGLSMIIVMKPGAKRGADRRTSSLPSRDARI